MTHTKFFLFKDIYCDYDILHTIITFAYEEKQVAAN